MTSRSSSEKNGLVIADASAIFSLAVIDQLRILNGLFDDQEEGKQLGFNSLPPIQPGKTKADRSFLKLSDFAALNQDLRNCNNHSLLLQSNSFYVAIR
ncbi:MAG: hypothetical protein OEM01_10675 [Desulfobulbaceae bacterium]|nr:hypothetical protein [Desulfobulbaceae bacterium]